MGAGPDTLAPVLAASDGAAHNWRSRQPATAAYLSQQTRRCEAPRGVGPWADALLND